MEVLPLKLRPRQGCLLSLHAFDIYWGSLLSSIRQEEKIKGIKIREGVIKCSLFADWWFNYYNNIRVNQNGYI